MSKTDMWFIIGGGIFLLAEMTLLFITDRMINNRVGKNKPANNIRAGQLVRMKFPFPKEGITCEVKEVRHDNLKSVVVMVTVSEDSLHEIK